MQEGIVIVRLSTGEAVLETFSPRVAAAINTERYVAIPYAKYITNINSQIKQGATGSVKYLFSDTETDARRNFDREFQARANQAQRRDCERTMQTPIAANGIEVSMFEDVKTVNAAGQVELF